MILLIAALFSLFPACQQKQERETAADGAALKGWKTSSISF